MCAHALTGCPARSGSSPAAASRRIASWRARRGTADPGSAWSSAPAGADSASSTRPNHLRALRCDVPAHDPAPPNVVASFRARSSKSRSGSSSGRSPRARSYICPNSPASSSRPRPAAAAATSTSSASSRYFSGSFPVHRQISRRPAPDLPGRQRRVLPADASPVRPSGVPHSGAPGDPGPVHQPGHRAVVPVIGVPLPGGERGQDPRPRRGQDRGVPLQLAQALGLGRGRAAGPASAAAR